jgi:hypothetical protein
MPAPQGSDGHWKRNTETGEWIMPPLQREFLEWLVDLNPEKGTMKAWGERKEIGLRSLSRWKSDARFIKEWESLADEVMVGPAFMQPIIQNMQRRAASSTANDAVRAAEVIFKLTNMIKPPTQRIEIAEDKKFEEFSNDELTAFLKAAADESAS